MPDLKQRGIDCLQLVRAAARARHAADRSGGTRGSLEHLELVVRLRQRRNRHPDSAGGDRHSARAGLRPTASDAWSSLAVPRSQRQARLVSARHARLGLRLHGRHRAHPHGAGLPLRRLQISARTHLDHRRLPAAAHARHGLHRTGAALRPGRLLGPRHRRFHPQPRALDRRRHWWT